MYAPKAPPITPGMGSLVNSFLSTFPSFRCDRLDVPLVNISAVWTLVLLFPAQYVLSGSNVERSFLSSLLVWF